MDLSKAFDCLPEIYQDLPSSGYMKTILLMPNCLFLNFQLLYQYYHLHVRECGRLQ
jgi:hypothetical protein